MAQPAAPYKARHFALTVASLTAALMLGACAQDTADSLQSNLTSPSDEASKVAANNKAPQTELEKATEYWGKKYKEHPAELEPALSYAKNLKAMGERQQALAVIQQAATFHGSDKQLASEYGRLALELDQISIAKQMLALADDPVSPDWRVISARGTVLAKEGKFKEAVGFYERALTLSQDQTSVMNNLAMAYAASGDAAKAEEVLRRIEFKGGNPKIRQNLALVLGLQGKFDEGKQVSAKEIGQDGAASDAEYMKRMVKVSKQQAWSTAVAKPGESAPVQAAATPAEIDLPVTPAIQLAPAQASAPGEPPLKGMSP